LHRQVFALRVWSGSSLLLQPQAPVQRVLQDPIAQQLVYQKFLTAVPLGPIQLHPHLCARLVLSVPSLQPHLQPAALTALPEHSLRRLDYLHVLPVLRGLIVLRRDCLQ